MIILDKLPSNLINKILLYLYDLKSLGAIACVSIPLNMIVMDTKVIAKMIIKSRYIRGPRFPMWMNEDPNIVKALMYHDRFALAYASDYLKDDLDTVIQAVKHNVWSIRFASKRLQKDPTVLKYLL